MSNGKKTRIQARYGDYSPGVSQALNPGKRTRVQSRYGGYTPRPGKDNSVTEDKHGQSVFHWLGRQGHETLDVDVPKDNDMTATVKGNISDSVTRAEANLGLYGDAATAAADAFITYAGDKIEVLAEENATLEEIYDGIASAIPELIMGPVGLLVAASHSVVGEAVHTIGEVFFEDAMEKAIKDFGKGSSEKELKAGAASLASAVKQGSQSFKEKALALYTAFADGTQSKIDDVGLPALEGEQDELCASLWRINTNEINAVLLGYGIPDPARSRELKLDLYRMMVEKFEIAFIKATASTTDLAAMATMEQGGLGGDSSYTDRRVTLKRTAKRRANQAREQYSKEN